MRYYRLGMFKGDIIELVCYMRYYRLGMFKGDIELVC